MSVLPEVEVEEPPSELTFDSLECLTEMVEPYMFVHGSLDDLDGRAETGALVLMKRREGLLLAVPVGTISESLLEKGNSGEPDLVFGPSLAVTLPGVVLDGGSYQATGEDVAVLIIDCNSSVVAYLRELRAFEVIDYGFAEGSPFVLPSPDILLSTAMDWVEKAEQDRMGFYSAESAQEEQPQLKGLPRAKSGAAKKAPARATPTGDGAKQGDKPKKATTASLAADLQQVLMSLPKIAEQVTEIGQRQRTLEDQVSDRLASARPQLSQPLSRSLELGQTAPVAALARDLRPPPRTAAEGPLGLLTPQKHFGPTALKELEMEKPEGQGGHAPSQDLAAAVLAQSQALTALVSQISTFGSDPMSDLAGASGGTGTRGAAGRAKLQAELAQQKGSFFLAVLQSMARRMNPSLPVDTDPSVCLQRGVSGVKYLERFGGYARQRELGMLQYQVLSIFDHLLVDNLGAARDGVALLAVTLEQMAMDNGKMDVAAVLSLQEDVPSSIFTNRNTLSTSRSRAFAPLADQRWITTTLAYLREMDVIAAKRLEFLPGVRQPSAGSSDLAPAPKRNPKSGPRGRGRGRNQNQSQQVEEEEQ